MPVPSRYASRMSTASRRDGTRIAVDGPCTSTGSSTWNPWSPAGAPSAWMEIATSACARLPIAARSSKQGPMLLLSVRLSTTVAPAVRRIAASRTATSKLKAASWYPASVWVPVVSHGFHMLTALTSLLMTSGWEPAFPLWPGSTAMILPTRLLKEPAAGGAIGPDRDGAGEVVDAGAGSGTAGAGPAPHEASRPSSTPMTRLSRLGDTPSHASSGRCEHHLGTGAPAPLRDHRDHLAGRVEHRVRAVHAP